MALVQLNSVSKSYGGLKAADAVSFSAEPGETLALIGESGCGKTTTLKMINRLIEPDSGGITLFGKDARAVPAAELRREIGYVFQGIGLFPHMTAAENIAATPSLLGWEEARTVARVDELLTLTRLDPAQHRGALPAELSGGQQQRVAIARALACEPRLILMDEPFGALDPLTRDDLRQDFKAIQQETGFTAILVTHDMAEAVMMADRILVMRGGRIVQAADPATLINHPDDDYVARLLAAPQHEIAAFESLREPAP